MEGGGGAEPTIRSDVRSSSQTSSELLGSCSRIRSGFGGLGGGGGGVGRGWGLGGGSYRGDSAYCEPHLGFHSNHSHPTVGRGLGGTPSSTHPFPVLIFNYPKAALTLLVSEWPQKGQLQSEVYIILGVKVAQR